MTDLQLVISEDGSHTLYNSELDETYHSIHGAVQESKHVFIQAGLAFFHEEFPDLTPNILEIGLGTGLNALLTAQWAIENKIKINYTGIEKFPLPIEITSEINYCKGKELIDYQELFTNIHSCNWETSTDLSEYFKFKKHHSAIEDITSGKYNLIYFDAFAPSKQEELWTIEIFKSIAQLSEPDAIFVTYCAKGQVRRDLESVGYKMERLKGPPGKAQMLRGKFTPIIEK